MITQLNNEAVLVMYLADELPETDRAEVEQQLDVDAGLRAQLAALAQAHDLFESAMSRLDAGSSAGQASGVHRLGKLMRRHMLDRSRVATVAAVSRRTLGFPAWAYPVAAAAMIVVGFVAVWGLGPDKPINIQVINTPRAPFLRGSTPIGSSYGSDWETDDELAADLDDEGPIPVDAHVKSLDKSLDAAELQVAELKAAPDDAMSSYFGFSDSNE
ncbi:MAG TPA: hypothetical protein VFC78_20475 [Tepidisphaeraceae bacterium]|nr:hypothetical protein [Tepidisphaeraceae bacterium]